MLKLDFTTEHIEALKYQKFHHRHPRVSRKMEALLLKNTGGVTALEQLDFYHPTSALESFKSAIITHFQAHPVVSINQVKAEIETLTGLSLCPPQIREFLVKLGIKRRKVGHIPAKADVEKQPQFPAEELQPRLEEAEKKTRQVFF